MDGANGKTITDKEFEELLSLFGKITGKRNRDPLARIAIILETIEMRAEDS